VILFLVDTLRADHLGCYGYARDTSPALDALAEDAVVFEACQAQSSWTKPATASILTGLLPSVHRAVHKVAALPPEHMLLAEPLTEAGYHTAAFGSNAFIFGPEQGFGRGFGVFESSDTVAGHVEGEPTVSAEVLVDAGLDWLDRKLEAGVGDEVFLYIHAVDPHDPYDPPTDLRDRFTTPLGEGQPTDAELTRPAFVHRRFGGQPPPTVLARMEGLYDAEILAADRAFGRLVDGLKARGIYDDALIVFVADHGEEFYDHGAYGHNPRLFEEVTRVPLVIKFPARLGDAARGERFAPRVRQVDVLPTVLDVVGLELAPERTAPLAGKSLLPLLLEATSERLDAWHQEPILTEVDYEGAYRKSLIRGPLKFVKSWAPSESEVLFDLARDPGESLDLAADEPERVEAMRAELARLTTLGSRGWGLGLQNRSDNPVSIAGLLTFTGAAFEGLDPLALELVGVDPQQQDGPFGQGWAVVEETRAGRGRIRYGAGPDLAHADMTALPELALGGLASFEGRAAWFFSVLEPGGQDGVLFVPGAETRDLRLMLWVDAKPVPASFVFLGPELTPAAAMPLPLGTGVGLEMPGAPSTNKGPEDRPLFAWIWKNLDPATLEVELSPETEANLRGLGYLGDD
jgi:arylsulfatase A-like enzyme